MTGILIALVFGPEVAWEFTAATVVVFMSVVLAFVGLAVGRALFAQDPSTRADALLVLRDLLGSFFRRPR